MTAFEWKTFFVWRVTYICVHVTQAQFLPTSSKHVSPGMRFLGLGIWGLSHQSCMSLHIGTNNIVEPTKTPGGWNVGTELLRGVLCQQQTVLLFNHFYPRPVLAFGYCHRLRLCVCPCVCQSLACPHNILGSVEARIAKFGPKMQKTTVKVPIVLGGNWPWPSRSNLTSKSEFTQFWACPDHKSSPIQVRITKFGLEVENSLVKVPIILGGNWPWPSRSNLI